MQNLEDFLNSKKQTNDTTNNESNYHEIKNDYEKYKDMSQQDLMSELIKQATRMKQNGTLTEDNLETLKSTLAPMLSPQQQEMLKNIIEKIK